MKEEKGTGGGKELLTCTTVTEANVHYPTYISLLADGIRVIALTVSKLKKVELRLEWIC